MFGKKVNNVRVFPVTVKIVLTFTLFILISNFTTNYINLMFNRNELFKLMNELLTKDLKNIYAYCGNQYDIFQYDKNLEGSVKSIENMGIHTLKSEKGVILGIQDDGSILFQSSKIQKVQKFEDADTLKTFRDDLARKKDEGPVYFKFNDENYFGMYKFNPRWNSFIVRGEELNEFYSNSNRIFRIVGFVIIVITAVVAIIGIVILGFILRYINVITSSIMKMINSQQLELIDLDGATNDDITYMGTAFNSLSSTVGNLIGIFRKFANQDIVLKAYRERQIKLEGEKKELTILFSDIKSFTHITETLGTDIIKLLNLHYDRAIREVVKYNGVIGSIIGDALLAVFGVLGAESNSNKSYEAIMAGYMIQEVTRDLRDRMKKIKDDMQSKKGGLTKSEALVYKAVLLEIGVGIDGGEVFYGTLGSYVRMTNTVIGDNVNAASRLEGLTRIYKVPVICSDYVKKDIEAAMVNPDIVFIELDTVMVKGKTTGKKIYWPILTRDYNEKIKRQVAYFEAGLKLYYAGDWKMAKKQFAACKLPVAEEFTERTKQSCPRNWNGIWEMKTK